MSRRGGNRGLPSWWKGAKLLDAIDGSEIYDYESSTVIQRGMKMHKKNFDSLTEEQREEQLKRRAR
jgi:hypothetical protein